MIPLGILEEIDAERLAQDRQWGGPSHDDGHNCNDWIAIMVRHLGLAASDEGAECGERFRRQLIRMAALAIAATESFDRKVSALAAELDKVAGKYQPGSGF